MSQQIYGLSCQTFYQDGASLTLSREPPLIPEELAQPDGKMLQRVQVPGLLPLEFQEVDSKITLRYSIANYRTLQQILTVEDSDIRMVASYLYAIASILEDSKVYMLNESRYVLHESYIYGRAGRVDDIRMLYIPLKKMTGKQSFQRELAQLTARVFELARIPRATGENLLAYVSDNAFHLTEWKTMLLSYIDSQSASLAPAPAAMHDFVPYELAHQQAAAVASPPNKAKAHSAVSTKLVLAVVFVLLVVNWAGVCYFASEGALMTGLGVTLLLADGLYYKLKVKKEDVNDSITEEPQPIAPAFVEAPQQQKIPQSPVRTADSQLPNSVEPLPAAFPGLSRAPSSNVYSALAQQTVLLRPQEETVLLAASGHSRLPFARLEVKGSEQDEILLQQEQFVIGRHPETSNYAVDTVGVSRMHVEIVRTGHGYSVKDLGSKNGTYLNGELLIPFQEYDLKEGDCITIVQTEFVFYER